MSNAAEHNPVPVDVAICIDGDALDRFAVTIRHLAVGLVDQRIDVRLLSSDARIEELSLGPIRTVPHQRIGWPFSRRRLDALLAALSSSPPTVVQASTAGSYRTAMFLSDALDAELVVQVTSAADCEALAELDHTRVRAFLALSPPLAHVLETQVGVAAEWISLVRPGIRASKVPGCFTSDDRTATILCTSPLESGSGVDALIQAIAALHARDRKAHLFLLGEGSRESKLRALVRQHDLSASITFVHPPGDLSAAFGGADLFVKPSKDTALCVETLQAMGAGMAVVAFPTAAGDHLKHEQTALLCEAQSADCLTDTIERLLCDRDLARTIAAAALAYVREHHAVSDTAGRMADVYRRLALHRATFTIKD